MGNDEHREQRDQRDELSRKAQIRRELLAPPQRETMLSAGRGGGPDRPARSYVTGRWTKWLRIVAIAVTIGAVLFTLARFPLLPETIPTHFNALGEPDAWGPRSSVLILAAVATVMTAALAWLSRFPRWFNYLREVTADNAQHQYRLGEQAMVGVTLGIALVFAGLLVATGTAISLNVMVFALPGLLVLLGATVWGLVRLGKA